MIHHVSFGVSDPARVAHVLTELTGAAAFCAPSPPFPRDAWLVIAGDDRGSLLEVLPASTAFDPEAPLGLLRQTATSRPVSTHVLVSSVVSSEEIEAVAEREGWTIQHVDTGLFKIVKLWIDGAVLIELFAKGEAARYVEVFGAAGMATVDDKLRDLESNMQRILSAKMTPKQLRAAL